MSRHQQTQSSHHPPPTSTSVRVRIQRVAAALDTVDSSVQNLHATTSGLATEVDHLSSSLSSLSSLAGDNAAHNAALTAVIRDLDGNLAVALEEHDALAGTVDGLGSRINEMDGALAQVMELPLLHPETSDAVCRVPDALSVMGGEMSEIREAVGRVEGRVEGVEEMARGAVDAVRGVGERLAEALGEMQATVGSLESAWEARWDALEASLAERSEKERREREAGEEEWRSRVEEKVAEQEERMAQALEEMRRGKVEERKVVEEMVETRVAALRKEMEEEMGRALGGVEERVREARQADFRAALDSAKTEFVKLANDVAELAEREERSRAAFQSDVMREVEELRGNRRETSGGAERALGEMKELVENTVVERMNAMTTQHNAAVEILNSIIQKIDSEIEPGLVSVRKMEARLDQVEEDAGLRLDALEDTAVGVETTLGSLVDTTLPDMLAKISETASVQSAVAKDRVAQVESRLSAAITSLTDVTSSLAGRVERVQASTEAVEASLGVADANFVAEIDRIADVVNALVRVVNHGDHGPLPTSEASWQGSAR